MEQNRSINLQSENDIGKRVSDQLGNFWIAREIL